MPRGAGRRRPLHERSRVRSVQAIVGIVAGVATVTALLLNILWHSGSSDGGPASRGSGAPASGSSGADGSPQGSRSANTPPIQLGTCLTTAFTVVPCGVVHRFDVVSPPESACTVPAAIAYLGGASGTDVIIVKPKALAIPSGASACVIEDASRSDRQGSAQGELATAGGDIWRRCFDGRNLRADVTCDKPHTREYVGVPTGVAPDPARCQQAAESYLGTTYAQVSNELAIGSIPVVNPNDESPRCYVEARSGNLLSAPLRNVGQQALPIVAPS